MLTFGDPRKPPYSKERANKVKAKFGGSAYFSGKYRVNFARPHFQQRLKERRFVINDAINILRTGKVTKEPEFEKGEWRYRIEDGKLVSRNGIATLVVVFKSETVLHFHAIFPRRR